MWVVVGLLLVCGRSDVGLWTVSCWPVDGLMLVC